MERIISTFPPTPVSGNYLDVYLIDSVLVRKQHFLQKKDHVLAILKKDMWYKKK